MCIGTASPNPSVNATPTGLPFAATTAVRAVTLLACSPRSPRGGRASASGAPNRPPAGHARQHSLHRSRHARSPSASPPSRAVFVQEIVARTPR